MRHSYETLFCLFQSLNLSGFYKKYGSLIKLGFDNILYLQIHTTINFVTKQIFQNILSLIEASY